MVLISNKGSFYNLTSSYCFVYSYKIHNRVLITKTALTKFAVKHPGWEFKTWKYVRQKIGISDEITLKSERLSDNAWRFENSYFTPGLFYFKLTICANQLCIIATRIMDLIDTWINEKVWDTITLQSLLFLWRWGKTVNNCICKVSQTYFGVLSEYE